MLESKYFLEFIALSALTGPRTTNNGNQSSAVSCFLFGSDPHGIEFVLDRLGNLLNRTHGIDGDELASFAIGFDHGSSLFIENFNPLLNCLLIIVSSPTCFSPSE